MLNVQGGVWPGSWHGGGVLGPGYPGGTSPLEVSLPAQVCSVGRGDRFSATPELLASTLEAALAQCGLKEASQVAIVRQRVSGGRGRASRRADPEGRPELEQRGGRQVRTGLPR